MMKIKYEFAVSEVAGESIAVSIVPNHHSVVVTLNTTARFMWELMMAGTDMETMVTALLEKYDGLDLESARAEAEEFVEMLRSNQLLEE